MSSYIGRLWLKLDFILDFVVLLVVLKCVWVVTNIMGDKSSS